MSFRPVQRINPPVKIIIHHHHYSILCVRVLKPVTSPYSKNNNNNDNNNANQKSSTLQHLLILVCVWMEQGEIIVLQQVPGDSRIPLGRKIRNWDETHIMLCLVS